VPLYRSGAKEDDSSYAASNSSSSSSSAGLELETLEETYTSSLFRTEPLYQFYDGGILRMGNTVSEGD